MFVMPITRRQDTIKQINEKTPTIDEYVKSFDDPNREKPPLYIVDANSGNVRIVSESMEESYIALFREKKQLAEDIVKIIEDEREACAKVCESTGAYTDELEMAMMCADAIRDRSDTKE